MSDTHQFSEQAPGVTGIYTATLARLYAKQGLYDQALAIYRYLSHTQPENQEWQKKIAALEQQRVTAGMTLAPTGKTAAPVSKGSPLAARRRSHQVVAHLERWLVRLRQQRGS
jgi:hypothetical protein